MKNSCDIKKGTSYHQTTHDDMQDKEFQNDVSMSNEDKSMLNGITGWFLKLMAGRPVKVTEKEQRDFINKTYGDKKERNFVFTQLMALLEANPEIRTMINDEAILQMLKIKKKTPIRDEVLQKLKNLPSIDDTEKTIKDFANKHDIPYESWESKENILKSIHVEMRSLDYSSLPLSTLTLLFNKANDLVKKGFGDNLGRGVLGKLRVEISTALGIAKHDASGAIYEMARHVVKYTQNITRHINRFAHENLFKDTGSDRKYGMDDIFKRLADFNKTALSEELRERLGYKDEYITDFFLRVMSGWVKWENGQWMIASNYAVRLDDNGKVVKYKTTGDPIYEFQDYETFDDYNKRKKSVRPLSRAEKDKKDRYNRSFFVDDNYVSMVEALSTDESKEMIDTLSRSAREIHKEVFKYAEEEFTKAHNLLMIELKQYFPNLNNDSIRNLLMSRDMTQEPEFGLLTEKEQADLKYIVDALGSYSILDPYFFGMQEFKEKEGGLPIIYNQEYFQGIMWEEALDEAKRELARAQSQLKSARELYMKDTDNKEYKDAYNNAKEKVKTFNTEVIRMELIRDRFDEYPVDHEGNVMPLARDVSALKSITNSFDIRNQRADKLVYNEYLNRMFSGLERNKLSISLLKALRMAKSDAAKDVIVSQYKGINNDPSARSTFMTIPIDLKNVTVFVNKIPLVNVTEETLSRKIRAFNSWITGMHLRKSSSAVLNATAIQEGFYLLGIEQMTKAASVISNHEDIVNKLVKIAGIVDFSEFIQQGLVQKATDMDLTEKQSLIVFKAVMKYWKDVNSGINKNKALRELRKVLIIEAENVPGAELMEGTESSRIKRRIKLRNSRRIKRIVNTFANYAIEKQYDMKETINNIPYKAWGTTWSSVGWVQRRFNLTMGQTEKMLRTWQFVAGILSAQESGLIPNVPLEELQGEDLEAAIEIGRLYVQMSAFSVGRENIGEISRGEVGGFLTKFKYFAMQKFGADVNKFKDALGELESVLGKDEPGNKLRAHAKLFGMLMRLRKYPQSKLRTSHPNVAALRSFLGVQGILTQFVDLFIFGPFAAARFIPGFRNIFFRVPGVRAIGGMTSDLISLTMLMPNMLIALSLGWGDDDDDLQDLFEYYMRRTMIGYGVTWSYDNFLLLMAFLKDVDTEEKARNIKRSLSPVLPREFEAIPGQPVDKAIEYLVDDVIG